MKLIKHTKFIYEYENFIEDSLCDKIINLLDSANISDEICNWGRNKERNNSAVNLTKCYNYHPHVQKVDDMCHLIFSKCHINYIKDNKLIKYILEKNNNIRWTSDYYYRFYNKNDFYSWHIDDHHIDQNVMSYLLYLNDDYEGGKLLFLEDKIGIQPKKGTMICFPCGIGWTHKSTKINKGIKKIIWSCFVKNGYQK